MKLLEDEIQKLNANNKQFASVVAQNAFLQGFSCCKNMVLNLLKLNTAHVCVRDKRVVDGKLLSQAYCSNCKEEVKMIPLDGKWAYAPYCYRCGKKLIKGEKNE